MLGCMTARQQPVEDSVAIVWHAAISNIARTAASPHIPNRRGFFSAGPQHHTHDSRQPRGHVAAFGRTAAAPPKAGGCWQCSDAAAAAVATLC